MKKSPIKKLRNNSLNNVIREKNTFKKLITFQKKLSTKKSCIEINYQETNTYQDIFPKSPKNIGEKFSYTEENDKEGIYELGKHLFKPLEDLEQKSAKDYYIVLDPLLRTNF